MMPGSKEAEYHSIFEWTPVRRASIPLFGFVAASAFLHALCFYIFQIVYPVTVSLLPPPARVNLITAETEAGRVLLRWIEAEDPALSAITQRPSETVTSLPPEPTHVPSYTRHQPALKQLPPVRPDLRIPSAQPPGPVALPRAVAPTGLAPTVPTSLQFAPLNVFNTPTIPPLHFAASHPEPPAVAQFRVAIDPQGAVQYCFLENSSGDPALDEQARRSLLLCRFAAIHPSPADPKSKMAAPLVWTTATLQWGNDLTPPAPASPQPPAP